MCCVFTGIDALAGGFSGVYSCLPLSTAGYLPPVHCLRGSRVRGYSLNNSLTAVAIPNIHQNQHGWVGHQLWPSTFYLLRHEIHTLQQASFQFSH